MHDIRLCEQPVASLVLVHGAGSGPWVFEHWPEDCPGIEMCSVDLHAGLVVGRASMEDFATAVVKAASRLPGPVALCGWSMGGLVAMLASRSIEPEAIVLLEPSHSTEVCGLHPEVLLMGGTFDPEGALWEIPAGHASPAGVISREGRAEARSFGPER